MKRIALIMMSLFIAAMVFAGCGSDTQQGTSKNKVLKVGATAVPHAEILEVVKPILAKEGIDLQIVEFSDYVQPNLAVNDKELDANFFQHEPYLENFIAEHTDVKLVSAGGIHIEPMGVYSKQVKDLKDLKEGAAVAIPNDPTNGGRSLLLLEKAGLLKLRDGVGVKATVQDIIDNPKNLQFKEVEAAQVPRALDDVDAAVINTNYAMQANLVPTRDAIVMEDSSSPYVNIVAVRAGDENRPEIKALIKAMQSPEVKEFINEKYKGAVVAAF
jgi:D-methionine transport system substrate-binding protein